MRKKNVFGTGPAGIGGWANVGPGVKRIYIKRESAKKRKERHGQEEYW